MKKRLIGLLLVTSLSVFADTFDPDPNLEIGHVDDLICSIVGEATGPVCILYVTLDRNYKNKYGIVFDMEAFNTNIENPSLLKGNYFTLQLSCLQYIDSADVIDELQEIDSSYFYMIDQYSNPLDCTFWDLEDEMP